ncbi:MAG: type II/IV secretion system ATPase subunit, partial [Methanomassiliicoccales archaeon]
VSGKHISVYQPILDASLEDGSRMNLTLGSEVTKKGSTFTIRKFSKDPISPIDLHRFGTVDYGQLAYFWTLIEHKRSLLISGGTASGKTTLLNALSMFIRPEDKIVSIEDTPEIQLDHENWVQSVARSGYGVSGISGVSGVSGISGGGGAPGSIGLYDLLVAALRQRPEYVIVGEVRGAEAFTLFQAISVGHASLSTVHAGSIDELLHRVENEPMNIPRVLFQSLDVVAFLGHVAYDKKRVRRIKGITEVLGVEKETNNLLTSETFKWDPRDDGFRFSGRSYVLEEISKETGIDLQDLYGEIEHKKRYLERMNESDIVHYREVSKAIRSYNADPEKAYRELEEQGCE